MKFSKRKSCIAIALAFSALGATSAIAQVQGGGSSLVAPSIKAEISLFGANPDSLTYFTAGSGAGQTAFLFNQPTALGTTVSGTIDFANSDAPLSTAQIASYTTAPGLGATEGPLIQIPFIVTPITVPYVNGPTATTDTLQGPQTTPGQTNSLALNDNDLCGIFSGKLKNWNQVTNPDTGTTFHVNKAITVVYRSDNSGTTDLLTRHLAAVCNSGNSAVTFNETLAFTANFPTGVPTWFVGESGSGNIRSELLSLSSAGTAAVAYISPDWTNTFLAPKSTSATPALAVASLLNPHTNTDIAPTGANASLALGAFQAPTGTGAANPANWVPAGAKVADPKTGYPMSGTSQIILSQCYVNANVSSSMVNFLNDHYNVNSASYASFTSIITGNGFATVPAAFQSAVVTDFLTARSTLSIGNSTVCTSGKGR